VELGDQEGLKIADVEGGELRIVMVEGVGMAVVKAGPPVETHEPVRLSGEKNAAAKLDEAMPDAAIREMLVKRRAWAWAEGDEGAAAAFEAEIVKLTDVPPTLPEGLDLRKKALILRHWWRAVFGQYRRSEDRDEAIRTFFNRMLAPHEYSEVSWALFHHPPPPEPPEWEPIIYLLQCKYARCVEEGDMHMAVVYKEAAGRLEQDFKDGVAATQVHNPKEKTAKAAAPAKMKSKAEDS